MCAHSTEGKRGSDPKKDGQWKAEFQRHIRRLLYLVLGTQVGLLGEDELDAVDVPVFRDHVECRVTLHAFWHAATSNFGVLVVH